ncbi:MAG: hypothetical protein JXA90_06805 [Planctomycetes bacterium]|nr:hypothetical protein [Planctomycetota bacterium]
MSPRAFRDHRAFRAAELALLRELAVIRAELLEESQRLSRSPGYLRGRPAHVCCTRRFNQMRITPLEAAAIAEAFRKDAELMRRLPSVLRRLDRELAGLKEGEDRQSFDCPLLDGTRCLVHETAKPIGCSAWHPESFESEELRFTRKGWKAFERRDRLNDRLYGKSWKLMVIPLWLHRVLRGGRGGGGGRRSAAASRP